VDVLVNVSLIGLSAVLIWSTLAGPRRAVVHARPTPLVSEAHSRNSKLPAGPVSLAGAPVKGDPDARVAVIEFADFQCSFCGKFARETMPELNRLYVDTGKVVFAFRQLPLTKIHALAFSAAESALCANQQGQFWALHDRLFQIGAALDHAALRSAPRDLGLNMPAYERCLEGTIADAVRQDMLLAQSVGISGTPNFLIGMIQADHTVKVVKTLSGAAPIADFQRVLDPLLGDGSAKIRARISEETLPAARHRQG
jgi:protein-disulfide isomerase